MAAGSESGSLPPRPITRPPWWQAALVVAVGVVAWIGGATLSNAARPSVFSGYVVQQGDPVESNLGWHAVLVEEAGDYEGADADNGLNLAGVRWRNGDGPWRQWAGPLDPAPDCLAPHVAVRAKVGYVRVRDFVRFGGRRAVWLECLGTASPRGTAQTRP